MSFERTALGGAELADLDEQALDAYLARRMPESLRSLAREEQALRLGLLSKIGSRTVPTAAGLLLFGHHPQVVHPEWGVGAIRVRGLCMSDPLADSDNLEGPLAALVAQALAFVTRHTQELPDGTPAEYSTVVMREAIVNALLHRDLRRSGRVALRIFDDRVEVWSPGGCGESAADIDEMLRRGGVSLPPNPLLASCARALGLCEQAGRGLVVMRHGVRKDGGELEVHASAREFLVVVPSRLRAPATLQQLT
jgi:ATP-dependent DNA helicase RecG